MADLINNLKQYVSLEMVIYGLVILAVVLIISLIMRSMRIKKVTAVFDEYEVRYTTLKNVPLSYKLSKTVALCRVNKGMGETLGVYQNKYDEVQDKLTVFSTLLAEADELVYSHKVAKAYDKLDELEPVAKECEEKVKEINALFDELLEQENQQRMTINALKNDFRDLKKRFNDNRGSYRKTGEYLDECITQIENMFSIFEEWMYASEFNKANEKQEDIRFALASFKDCLDQLPGYYEKACVQLPNREEDIAILYSDARQNGVYLEHLDVKKNIELVSDMIADVISRLALGSYDNAENTLHECDVRMDQLEELIEKEKASHYQVTSQANDLFSRVRELNVEVADIRKIYGRIHERFGFENLDPQISVLEEQLDSLNENRFKLENLLNENTIPYTNLHTIYDEVEGLTTQYENTAKDLKEKLENATSDEQRAKKQLVKLQLLINEMSIQISKHRLPSVDDKFEEDIRNANVYIVDIKETLDETPLNVDKLNAQLNEAIDYIYTLYNSVNNLIGMAVMVENAILFGNKYRSEYAEVDSELTRAELCFSNGQYTKALKIAISTIEKLHPGVYEKLISASEVGANADA